jgi:hypothetical protein
MAHVTLTLEEYEALRSMISSERESEGATLEAKPKKKRKKVSKYSREFGIQLSKLIKKHPRTKVTSMMEKAHSKTRSSLGMPRKSKK